ADRERIVGIGLDALNQIQAARAGERARDSTRKVVLELNLRSLNRLSIIVRHHTGDATGRHALRVQRRNHASRKPAQGGGGDKQESSHANLSEGGEERDPHLTVWRGTSAREPRNCSVTA